MQILTPPEGLYSRIINRINYEQKLLQLKRRLFLSAFFLIGASFTSIPLYRDFALQIKQGEFIQFFTLLFTDYKIISSYLSDYLLSLVESLPVISFALLCAIILIILVSAIRILKYTFELKQLRLAH